jgi:hypothetical protein
MCPYICTRMHFNWKSIFPGSNTKHWNLNEFICTVTHIQRNKFSSALLFQEITWPLETSISINVQTRANCWFRLKYPVNLNTIITKFLKKYFKIIYLFSLKSLFLGIKKKVLHLHSISHLLTLPDTIPLTTQFMYDEKVPRKQLITHHAKNNVSERGTGHSPFI